MAKMRQLAVVIIFRNNVFENQSVFIILKINSKRKGFKYEITYKLDFWTIEAKIIKLSRQCPTKELLIEFISRTFLCLLVIGIV